MLANTGKAVKDIATPIKIITLERGGDYNATLSSFKSGIIE